MAISKYDLDINKQAIIKPVVILRQGDHDIDTMQVSLSVANEPMDLTGATVTFMGTTAGGKQIIDDAHVKIIDAKSGVFEYVFPSEAASDIGGYRVAYFSIIQANGQSSTMDFRVQVLSGVDISAPVASEYIAHYDTMVSNLNSAYDSATKATNQKMASTVSSLATSAASVLDSALARVNDVDSTANSASSAASKAVSMASSVAGTVTSQASYINSVASSAASNVSSVAAGVVDKLNNISVGGRNLYLNSKSDLMPKGFGINVAQTATIEHFDSTTDMLHIVSAQGSGKSVGIYIFDYGNGKIPNNSDWSYSADIKGIGKIAKFGIEDSSISTTKGVVGNNWSRVSQTGHVNEPQYKSIVMYFDTTNSPLDVYIKLPKLEIGNIATDWTPAPEDAPSGLSIGGRNLLLDTGRSFTGVGDGSTRGDFNAQGGQYYLAGGKKVSDLYKQYGPSGYLTLSFDWVASGSTISGQFNSEWNDAPWLGLGDPTNNAIKPSVTNTSGHYEKTVPLNLNGYSTSNASGIRFRRDNLQGNITISNLKLEAGNVASDWTPAPEDVVQKSGDTMTGGLKGGQVNLPASGDLNTLTDTGKYYQTTSVNAVNWSNRPSNAPNLAFSVDVIGQASKSPATQIYYVHTTSRMWVRTLWFDGSMNASPWAELANDDNVVHKTSNETVAGDKTFTGNVTIPKNKVTVNTAYGTFTLTKTLDIVHIQSHVSKDIPDNINVPNVVPQGFRPDGVSVPMTFIHGLDSGVIAVNPDGSLYTSSNIVPNTSFLAASWAVAGN